MCRDGGRYGRRNEEDRQDDEDDEEPLDAECVREGWDGVGLGAVDIRWWSAVDVGVTEDVQDQGAVRVLASGS